MEKNLFSITSLLNTFFLLLIFSAGGNAQVLQSGSFSQETTFNAEAQINFTPFQVEYTQPVSNFEPDGTQALLYDNGSAFNVAGPPPLSVLQTALGMNSYGLSIANASNFSIADDFTLAADADISSIDFYSYQTGSGGVVTINAVYVRIYDGVPGSGGSVIWGDMTTNILGAASQTGGYRVLDTNTSNTDRPIQIVTANTTGLSLTAGTYWVEFSMGGTSSSGPWAPPITITGSTATGNALQNNGTAFTPAMDTGTNTQQGYPFQIYGDETGGGSFPSPYCEVTGLSIVEAISRVLFADIDNVSDPSSSAPRHEDFTSITAHVDQGSTYSMAVEGNTAGNFTTSVRVYIDWNQDGDFTDADEYYYIGTIVNSTGTDGIQAVADIAVPATALTGNTRMRVIKKFSAADPSPNDGCTGGSSFGQAEDYTINIATGGGPFPSPYCEVTGLSSVEPITRVLFADIDNVSDPSTSAPSHEDFTSVTAHVEQGNTYSMAVEGYTGGNWTNSVRVYIDWNQDGDFTDADEYYYIGTIVNSTGTDGIQAVADIAVPATALTGNTRMRVIKKFSAADPSPNDGCTGGSSFGQAEDYTINVTAGGGGPFPDPYCDVEFPSDVEPISRVVFNTIDNSSDPTVNGSPALEDFTAVTTSIEQGGTYPIAVEGNTNGAFTTYVTVYIDYDQSGTFEESERTNIGTIFNSTGTDGVQATGNINVPSGATEGPTRMRVLKKWGGYVTDPCNTTGYGQAEDYTVTILPGGGGGSDCDTVSPSNGFENGGSFLKNMGRIAANDVIVPAGKDMTLESITFNAFIGVSGSGVNADNVDLFIFADAGGQPGAELHSEIGIVPTSQTVIGSNFGFDVWQVEIDFPDYLLNGDAGSATNYWVGLSLEPTDGSNTFWEDSSAAIVNNYNMAYFDGTVWDMTTWPGMEGVYTFTASCSDIGGGGTDCDTESPSNGFENGGSFLKNMGRIAANDVIVPVNQQMLLQSITFNAFIGVSGSGVNADNVDLFIFADAGGQPGAELHSELGIVPTSQTVIGSNFGFDVWQVEIDFPDYLLTGNTGSATNYWVGLSLEPTDGSNTFWEDSSAAIVNNYNMAYFDGTVWDMTTFAGLEGVYTFHAVCSTLGVSDVTADFDFAYYPNPVREVLNITSQKAVKTVEAFNMTGQKVLSTNKVINGQIDVNALSPGVYVFKAVLEGGQVETFKIIKK